MMPTVAQKFVGTCRDAELLAASLEAGHDQTLDNVRTDRAQLVDALHRDAFAGCGGV
jgi:hypothetical protein